MNSIFVFDTNCLISTHLLPNSINRKAYDHARAIGILLYSQDSLSGFSDTFQRSKFDKYISVEQREKDIRAYREKAFLINVASTITDCRDPKDNKFLELAIEGHATCIVTGDKDLLVLHPFRNIPIITLAEFLERY